MANIFKNLMQKNWYFRRCNFSLFGTAGIKILASDDAKNSMQTALQLFCVKSCVMKVVTSVQENAEDIYAEAQQINEEREAKAAVVEDEEVTETAEETEETEEEDFTEA